MLICRPYMRQQNIRTKCKLLYTQECTLSLKCCYLHFDTAKQDASHFRRNLFATAGNPYQSMIHQQIN